MNNTKAILTPEALRKEAANTGDDLSKVFAQRCPFSFVEASKDVWETRSISDAVLEIPKNYTVRIGGYPSDDKPEGGLGRWCIFNKVPINPPNGDHDGRTLDLLKYITDNVVIKQPEYVPRKSLHELKMSKHHREDRVFEDCVNGIRIPIDKVKIYYGKYEGKFVLMFDRRTPVTMAFSNKGTRDKALAAMVRPCPCCEPERQYDAVNFPV